MVEDGTPLRVDVVEEPGRVVVKVVGDVDLSTVTTLTEEASQAVHGPSAILTIDMAGVNFCDSAGINGLVKLRNTCDDAGWAFEVVGLRGHVYQVIVELTGLGEFLGVRPAQDGA